MSHREVMKQALAFTLRDFATVRDFEAARAQLHDDLKAALAEQCQCGDRPAAKCPGAWEPGCDLGANEAHAKVHEPQEPDAYRYALGLASSIWSMHYKDTAPGWKPLDDLVGLLTQIDNMVTGLVRQEKAALAEPTCKDALQVAPQEPVAWVECDGELVWNNKAAAIGRNLYTHPAPKRTPLTDEEILKICQSFTLGFTDRELARAIEKAHGIGGQDGQK